MRFRSPFEPLPGGVEFVPAGDEAALAAAIDTLAADPALRGKLGWQGRVQAEEKHSWAGAVDHILDLAGRANG